VKKYIEKIEVRNLFGYYNYNIDKKSPASAQNNLLIVYGDNGSGKTTILKLIFYLLSTLDNAGHKSEIAKVKFERFTIFIAGGIKISAVRPSSQLIGSYELIVEDNATVLHKILLVASDDFKISISSQNTDDNQVFNEILKYIKSLSITIHYLSDSRKLLSVDENIIQQRNSFRRKIAQNDFEMIIAESKSGEEVTDLEVSIRKLENWIKKHVLQASKAGDKNTNAIYTDLIKRVSSSTSKLVTSDEVINLVDKLIDIRKENAAYSSIGLVSKIETKEIESALEDSSKYNMYLIYNVLEPYVEGLRGRLDSLKEIQKIINLFIKSTNGYFTNKTIKYHLHKGFNITDNELNEPIDFGMLSSGEKQLLLLFCNVITASEDASIFIIDEPEISLNIKWQRKLIQTLLDFAPNKKVQFLFASHSIELLTGQKDSVSKLVNIKEA